MTYIIIFDDSRYIFQGLVIILEYWELINIRYPFSLCYIFRGLWSTSGTYMYLPGWLGQRNWASRSPKSLLTSSHQSFKQILDAIKRPQSHTAHCYVLYFSVLLMLKYSIGFWVSWWLRIFQLRWLKNREIEKQRDWNNLYLAFSK